MASLSEKYRPRHFAGVVGQAKAVSQVKAVLAQGWGGRSWLLRGPSGCGKSTIANLIADAGADPFFVEELDAAKLTPAKLDKIEESMAYKAMSKRPGKAFVIDECQALRADGVNYLLVLLERLPEHVVFVFTTTVVKTGLFGTEDLLFGKGIDPTPFTSRCTSINLENGAETRAAMAQRAKRIAEAQKIDGFDDAVYADAVDQCRGNLRMLLSRIESGSFVEDATRRRALRAELAAMPTETKVNAKRRRELAELLEAA